MDKNNLVNKINEIYKNYDEYFHSICDYAVYTLYQENNIVRYNDDLFLTLQVVRNMTPVHDLMNYCRIPKNGEELNNLMNKLRYKIAKEKDLTSQEVYMLRLAGTNKYYTGIDLVSYDVIYKSIDKGAKFRKIEDCKKVKNEWIDMEHLEVVKIKITYEVEE